MDFLSSIQRRKGELKPTKIILTDQLGHKFEIYKDIAKELDQKGMPFIVDNYPDLQMASIVPGLFLSSQDPVFCLDILKCHGIRHILSLGINPTIKFNEIKYHYIEILDVPEFDIESLFKRCVETINSYRNENILVHCNAGVSRSPTIIIAYLMIHEKLTYEKAYCQVKSIRNCIKPNDGFMRQLRNLECLAEPSDTMLLSRLDSEIKQYK